MPTSGLTRRKPFEDSFDIPGDTITQTKAQSERTRAFDLTCGRVMRTRVRVSLDFPSGQFL